MHRNDLVIIVTTFQNDFDFETTANETSKEWLFDRNLMHTNERVRAEIGKQQQIGVFRGCQVWLNYAPNRFRDYEEATFDIHCTYHVADEK